LFSFGQLPWLYDQFSFHNEKRIFVEVLDILSAAKSVYVTDAVKYFVSILTLVLIPVSDTGNMPAEKKYRQTLSQQEKTSKMRKLKQEMINIVHLV
jgi:hypothetical protein